MRRLVRCAALAIAAALLTQSCNDAVTYGYGGRAQNGGYGGSYNYSVPAQASQPPAQPVHHSGELIDRAAPVARAGQPAAPVHTAAVSWSRPSAYHPPAGAACQPGYIRTQQSSSTFCMACAPGAAMRFINNEHLCGACPPGYTFMQPNSGAICRA